ncbi:hypothetical protein Taro_040237, partial [Colocasia esculenta]|nr:hypothetical protein [Colocasia esculenta]
VLGNSGLKMEVEVPAWIKVRCTVWIGRAAFFEGRYVSYR